MKKTAMLAAAAAMMALALAGCGSQAATTAQSAGDSAAASAAQEAAQEASTASSTASNAVADAEKTLIVYFTPANSDTADAVTSATPRVNGTASVAYLAGLIGEHVDAETAKIVPDKAYPTGYDKTARRAESQQEKDARPGFSLSPDVDPEDYDTIFVGYPMWYYQMPMVMDTFFDRHDFSGKTIVPFNTHAGSGDGGTYDDIAELEPDAMVREGLAVAGDDAADAAGDVESWLSGLGY